jgi:hypothetical protein
MKNLLNLRTLAAVVLPLALSSQATAQWNGASASTEVYASAYVAAPIQISNWQNLSFGGFVPNDSFGEVTVDAYSSVYFNNLVPMPGFGSPQPAQFYVTAVPYSTYSISLPYDAYLYDNYSGASMYVYGIHTDSTQRSVPDWGSDIFPVGATLQVAPYQQTGSYSGTFTVSVNYN